MTPLVPVDLGELADRVEALTGPDQALVEEVAVAFGWKRPQRSGVCGKDYALRSEYEWHDASGQARGFQVPPFLTSLDAAMTLVPEGCEWDAGVQDGRGRAGVMTDAGDILSWGATPATALTAACLRALQAKGDGR